MAKRGDYEFSDKKDRQRFEDVRRAEVQYQKTLRSLARRISEITHSFMDQFGKDFSPETPEQSREYIEQVQKLNQALDYYSRAIDPWAKQVANSMLADVVRRDHKAWQGMSEDISRALTAQTSSKTALGRWYRAEMTRQVDLITSLPRDAGLRAQKLAMESVTTTSARSSEISKEIMRTGEVSKSRADLIARTEVSRASSQLVMVRAQSVGSDGYIWRTSRDSDVRPSHAKMEGKFVRWDTPPTLNDGTVTHAGCIYNCRCYPEPVVPEIIK